MWRVKSGGLSTQPCGEAGRKMGSYSDPLGGGKFLIQRRICCANPKSDSLVTGLKSVKSSLPSLPCCSRCVSVAWRAVATASSVDLLPLSDNSIPIGNNHITTRMTPLVRDVYNLMF